MHGSIKMDACLSGMKCGGCVSRVKRILEGHTHVTQVHAALESHEACKSARTAFVSVHQSSIYGIHSTGKAMSMNAK